MYHRINSPADEERLLLEQKLALQSSIRAKRERQRRKRTHDTEVYTKMLAPVTKSIAKLTPPTSIPANAVVKQEPVKKEEDEDEVVDDEEGEGEIEPTDEPYDESDDLMMVVKEEPDDLYKEALAQIPRKIREDGQLGLCPTTHQIGDYTYAVYGNTLQAVSNHDEDEDMQKFDIRDLNLWKLLLVLNPTKIGLKLTVGGKAYSGRHEYLPFVQDYVDIARKLNLLDTYRGSKNRVKYALLTHHWGSGVAGSGGFLYSSIPPQPQHAADPSSSSSSTIPRVVVLPPDNPGLMSELYRALAELRAGNTSMRNLVVPMVREARRRRIRLPPDLLTTPYEDTWTLV